MAFSQDSFHVLYDQAYESYNAKDYKNAGRDFSKAYLDNYNNKKIESLSSAAYNAACSWSLASEADSAFFILKKAITDERFLIFYDQLFKDEDFINLYKDVRWEEIATSYKQKKQRFDGGLNKEIVSLLTQVRRLDQEQRLVALDYEKKYGGQSVEAKDKWREVERQDVENFKVVSHIIDSLGWLSPKVVGYEGAQTLFMVIQHASLSNQLKYLPVLRKAVKKGNAQVSNLAYLEDRVALRQKLPQKYGTQLVRDGKTGRILYPDRMLDPENVDKRRAEVGLEPIAGYLKRNGATWDIAEYMKKFP